MNKNLEKYSKLQWTQQEESYLKQLKQERNLKSWKFIAGLVNQKFQQKCRNGKQCRQRYMNYVRFTSQKPKILGWTQSDDYILFDNFLEHGAKWVQISNHMPGRSQNCLKNRFYGALRRVIRKINKIQKDKKLKYKKSIKYDSLMKILSYKTYVSEQQSSQFCSQTAQKNKFIEELRKDLIKLSINQDEQFSPNQVLSLIIRIHQFNCIGRTPTLRKIKSNQTIDDQVVVLDSLKKEVSNYETQKQLFAQQGEQKSTQQRQQGCSLFYEQQPDSFISIINQNKMRFESARNLEQELCQILNQKYAPQCLPYF